jgi:hypothetical protein
LLVFCIDFWLAVSQGGDMAKSYRDRYQEYISSAAWQRKRSEFFSLPENQKCHICLLPGLFHVHHNTYDNFTHEKMRDLHNLCPICHIALHERYQNKQDPRFRIAAKIMASEWWHHTRQCDLPLINKNRYQHSVAVAKFFGVDTNNDEVSNHLLLVVDYVPSAVRTAIDLPKHQNRQQQKPQTVSYKPITISGAEINKIEDGSLRGWVIESLKHIHRWRCIADKCCTDPAKIRKYYDRIAAKENKMQRRLTKYFANLKRNPKPLNPPQQPKPETKEINNGNPGRIRFLQNQIADSEGFIARYDLEKLNKFNQGDQSILRRIEHHRQIIRSNKKRLESMMRNVEQSQKAA